MDKMKKLFLLGCGIVILTVIAMVVLVLVNNSKKAKELVCSSTNSNITIYYDENTVIGYTGKGYDYELLSEKSRAEQIGIEKYLDEFSNTYTTSTFGTCTKNKN